LAVVAGLWEILPLNATSTFEANDYLGYHLFATAVQILAKTIDRWMPAAIGATLLSAALLRIGTLGRGKVRLFLRFVLPLLTFGAVIVIYLLRYPDHRRMVTQAVRSAIIFCGHHLVSPYSLLLALALLGWVEWRILRSRRRAAAPDSEDAPAAAYRLALFALCRLILRQLAVGVLVLLLLLAAGLNLAWGLYRWHNLAALRSTPNVIFIMVDTLRVDHLGCYGYDLPTTPNIDRFAQTGTRFEQAIAQGSYTPFSVSSLFSSQYPDVLFTTHSGMLERMGVGIQDQIAPTYGTPLAFTTLAEVLHDRGYSTSAVVSNVWIGATPGNMQGYDSYNDKPSTLNRDCNRTSPTVTRDVIARLRQVKDKRFFMSVAYMDPHYPYCQNPGFTFGESRHDRKVEQSLSHTLTGPPLAKRRRDLARYDSEIAYTDRAIGDLLAELKTQGLYDNALIVFFADHGEEFREHGGVGHGRTVYQELIHVPLIIKLPRQRTGRVVRGNFPLIDVTPSLLSYLGYPRDRFQMQGDAVDLSGVLRCKEKPIFSTGEFFARCIISGQRKYAVSDEDGRQLLNLAADPLEQHVLPAKQLAEAKTLVAQFDAWNDYNMQQEVRYAGTKADQQRWQASFANSPSQQAMIKQLKSLGYLHE